MKKNIKNFNISNFISTLLNFRDLKKFKLDLKAKEILPINFPASCLSSFTLTDLELNINTEGPLSLNMSNLAYFCNLTNFSLQINELKSESEIIGFNEYSVFLEYLETLKLRICSSSFNHIFKYVDTQVLLMDKLELNLIDQDKNSYQSLLSNSDLQKHLKDLKIIDQREEKQEFYVDLKGFINLRSLELDILGQQKILDTLIFNQKLENLICKSEVNFNIDFLKLIKEIKTLEIQICKSLSDIYTLLIERFETEIVFLKVKYLKNEINVLDDVDIIPLLFPKLKYFLYDEKNLDKKMNLKKHVEENEVNFKVI